MRRTVALSFGGFVATIAGLGLALGSAAAPSPASPPGQRDAVVSDATQPPSTALTEAARRQAFRQKLRAKLQTVRALERTGPAPDGSRSPDRSARIDDPPAPATDRARPAVEPVQAVAPAPVFFAAALGRPTRAVDCLAQAIYYEARSESEEGQIAVAEVVVNRARSGRYPRDICGVVYQRNARTCQFSYTCDGSIGRTRINARSWAQAERIAHKVLSGQAAAVLPPRSVNYHANYVAPSWGRRLERVRQIGAHIFYGAPLSGQNPGAAIDEPSRTTRSGGLVFARLEALDQVYADVQNAISPASSAGSSAAELAVGDPGS